MKGVAATCPFQGHDFFHQETGLLSGLFEGVSISRTQGFFLIIFIQSKEIVKISNLMLIRID